MLGKIIIFMLILQGCIGTSVISEEKAIKIGEEELLKVYGDTILKQRPFKATLHGDVWEVRGTLHCPQNGNPGILTVCSGGVGEVMISKQNGAVLRIIHHK